MIDKKLEANKNGKIMQIERTKDGIIIGLPSYVKIKAIEIRTPREIINDD